MRINKFIKNITLILTFLCIGNVRAVTYLSSASNGAAWTSTTTLDAYQNTATNFVGASSSVSYNPNGGDTLKGLFMFANGFASLTTGSLVWAARGVIDGPFSIYRGVGAGIQLRSPLHLGPNATFSTVSTGSFALDGYDSSGSGVLFLEGNNVRMDSGYNIYNTFTIDGLGHQLTLSSGGYLNGMTSPALIMRNMTLAVDPQVGPAIFSNMPITLKDVVLNARGDSGSHITLLNSSSYTITVSGNVRFEGFGNRIKVAGNISIDKNSTLYVGPGVTLTDVASFTMADQTSVLHLDGCDFYTGHDGSASAITLPLSFTTGTLLIDNKVRIFNRNYGYAGAANTDMTKGFIIGGSGSSNYADVVVRSGAYLVVDGCMDYVQS